MKKITFLLTFIFWSGFLLSQNQDIISGPSSLANGETGTFSVPEYAQCEECYDWDISGSAVFETADNKSSVTVTSTSSNGFTLEVKYFNENGCIPGNPFPVLPGNICTQPVLESYFVCDGWEQYAGHGAVYISFPDGYRSTISHIEWTITNATFISGTLEGLSSGTTYGSGSPGNIGNFNCNNIGVQAVVHYNNGCSPVTVTETIIPSPGTGPIKPALMTVYPNPTNSTLKVNMNSIEDFNDMEVKLIDINSGAEVYSKKLNGQQRKELIINNLEKYKFLEVLFIKNGKVLDQKRVIVK